MERISLVKDSQIKSFVLRGAEAMGYAMAIRTNCVESPITVYLNENEETVLIYNAGLKRDEMIIVSYTIPAKLKVIIDEYKGFTDSCHRDVAELLGRILDGTYRVGKKSVTFL